jgi:perosamine synthetase
MNTPKVKYELEVSHGSIYGPEEAAALMECLENRAPSCGRKVKEFETAFAEYCGVRYALAVTSATTGLTLACIAAGIRPGDEVITTPISWISTASAFSTLGAKVAFCDVDARTLCMDPAKLEPLITPRTRAIVPVHLYGQCADMDGIRKVAGRHGIPVIEDCAHNPGGEYDGRKSGSLGTAGVFSFHQQKNMGTLGEGGMLTTDSREFFEAALSYRSLCCRIYGPSDKYLSIDETEHPMGKRYWELQFDDFGYNFRMTDAQACVGLEQLKKLERHNARRMELANRLTEKLKGTEGLILPWVDPKGRHVWHIYMVQLANGCPVSKEDFMWKMYTGKGIKAWSHYMPIHLTAPYRAQGHREGECPVCEEVFGRYVTLPIHPRLTDGAIDYMAESIKEIVSVCQSPQ